MTGCMLMADDLCLVISEGSQKAQKKYNRLMMNRIDWNQGREDEQQGRPCEGSCASSCQSVRFLHAVADSILRQNCNRRDVSAAPLFSHVGSHTACCVATLGSRSVTPSPMLSCTGTCSMTYTLLKRHSFCIDVTELIQTRSTLLSLQTVQVLLGCCVVLAFQELCC